MTDAEAGRPGDDARATETVITRLGARGDGVAQRPDGPLYAPYTLAGERVRGRIDGDRLRDVVVVTPSPDRVTPACPHFGVCGGCVVQHLERRAYHAWKRGLVRAALARVGVETEVGPVLDATRSGRRRATFHAVRAKAVGFAFGFAARGSHHVVALEQCPVLHPRLAAALPLLARAAAAAAPRPGRADLQATWTDTGLDVDLRGVNARDHHQLTAELAALAEEGDWARVTIAGEPRLQRRAPEVRFDGAPVTPPPGVFLQATEDGEAALAALVAAAGEGAAKAVDLFAGLGTFALRLAQRMEVRAFEGDPAAAAALAQAVKRAPAAGVALKPTLVQRRDLARAPVSARELGRPGLVVMDPPRAGAGAQARELAQSGAQRVVYVSCNPASFARDAKVLIEGGLRLESVRAVDQFLWSAHVELVGVFTR